MKPPINSVKHIVQRSLVTIDTGTILNIGVAAADELPDSSSKVRIGATIKAVYVELWYIGSSSQPVTQTSCLEKNVAGAPVMTHAEAQVLHDYPNKKNLYYTTQGIVGDANTNPAPLVRGWFKIPKGKQRFGLGDNLTFNIAALGEAANDLEVCGLFIYKEYF